MKIEFLYFEGCPYYQTALRNLEQVLEEERAGIPVDMVRIESQEQALRNRFVGSPTVKCSPPTSLRLPPTPAFPPSFKKLLS